MPARVAPIAEQIVYRSILERMIGARDILLVSPKRPDGDSIGSICGLYGALRSVGKSATLYCPDPIPQTFDHIPYVYEVRSQKLEVRSQKFDAIVVVDAGDLAFAGIADELPIWKAGGGQLIVIDHHATNTRYGDINCVATDAASTTEIIYRMLVANRVPLTVETATCLLYGLVTDTDGFTNPATSPAATATASQLMAAGARIAPILQQVYRSKPIAALRLWGRAFERLRVHPRWGIATTVLIPEDFRECADGIERAEALELPPSSAPSARDSRPQGCGGRDCPWIASDAARRRGRRSARRSVRWRRAPEGRRVRHFREDHRGW